MVPHGVHMVYICTAEIKEYDIRAHVYGMVALCVMIQCSKHLSKELTLVLSDTRELNRVPSTK